MVHIDVDIHFSTRLRWRCAAGRLLKRNDRGAMRTADLRRDGRRRSQAEHQRESERDKHSQAHCSSFYVKRNSALTVPIGARAMPREMVRPASSVGLKPDTTPHYFGAGIFIDMCMEADVIGAMMCAYGVPGYIT